MLLHWRLHLVNLRGNVFLRLNPLHACQDRLLYSGQVAARSWVFLREAVLWLKRLVQVLLAGENHAVWNVIQAVLRSTRQKLNCVSLKRPFRASFGT